MDTADLARRRAKRLARRRSSYYTKYGPEFLATRRMLKPIVAAGLADCVRCQQPIEPGTPWDLGHDERTGRIKGPEHAVCNRGAPNRNNTSRVW